MVDFVEQANNSARTIEELLVEFVPQVFKRYFQIFLLKANQQFVEILTKAREYILFAYPTNFTASMGKKLHRLFGAKRVTM